jgi:hypothetical protein
MPGFASINESGGGLVVKTLHQCVLQTQARVVRHPVGSYHGFIDNNDDAEIVSSNLTRRAIFLLDCFISLTM